MALSSDEVRKLREELEGAAMAQKKLQTSVKGLVTQYADVYKLAKQITDAKAKHARATEKIKKIEDEINSKKYSGKKLDDLKQELAIRNQILIQNEKSINDYQKQLDLLKKQAFSLQNIASAIGNSIYKGLKSSRKEYQQFDKAARSTAISMGLTGKNVDAFRKSLSRVAVTTSKIGFNYEDLAKAQGRYSDQLGRAVVLSDKGLESIAKISEGTLLGAEGAADLAASMDMFGISAEVALDRVQETVDLASKMGVNTTKVVKIMQDNLKLANKYNFKDGTKNIMKMAAMTAKFKLEMESVASMAEKLFEPEGAIEMAANLQVLGGEFSKLADPFRLMFMSRNDMEGLQKSIIEATKGIVQFNKASGEFDISAQELHRLRKVADATGISVEQLVQTAREFAKVDMIKKNIKFSIPKDLEDFVTSAAQWSKEKKGFVLTFYDKEGNKTEKLVNELDEATIKMAKNTAEDLEKRALQSKTFDETLSNLITQLKASLLPLLQGIDKGLRGPLDKLMKYLSDEKIIEKFSKIAEKIGGFAESIIEFMVEKPGWIASIAIAFEGVKWLMYGRMLGVGFNSVARVGGGFRDGDGADSLIDMITGKGKGKGYGNFSKSKMKKLQKAGYRQNKAGKWMKPGSSKFASAEELTKVAGKGGFLSKLGKGKNLLKPGPLALLGLGVDLGNEALKGMGAYEEGSGWDKGLNFGSSIAEYAGLGAMIGSAVPGIGTAFGGIAGGIFGAGKGIYNNFIAEPEVVNQDIGYKDINTEFGSSASYVNDAIIRPGKPPIIPDKNDFIYAAKSGGPIEKALSSSGNITIEFKPLKIEGKIDLTSNGSLLGSIDLDKNPQFIRELSKYIQEEVGRQVNGGHLSPNVTT